MVKNHKLAKSIMDSRYVKVPKSLAKKIHRHDKCNLVLYIDHNTSINILKRLKIFNLATKSDYYRLSQELWEVTPVEISMRSVKQEETTGLIR